VLVPAMRSCRVLLPAPTVVTVPAPEPELPPCTERWLPSPPPARTARARCHADAASIRPSCALTPRRLARRRPTGWLTGDQIGGREVHQVIAGFNGGFKLTYSNVGFVSGGHVAVRSRRARSIVTYANGTTDIGAWGAGSQPRREGLLGAAEPLLLVSNALAAPTVSTCITTCWATRSEPDGRCASALGITASGELIWRPGEHLTRRLARERVDRSGRRPGHRARHQPGRVAADTSTVHHAGGPVANPLVPGQLGIAGQLLAPDTRDFPDCGRALARGGVAGPRQPGGAHGAVAVASRD